MFCLAGQSDRATEALAAKYRGKVTFVFIYGPEAHPEEDGAPSMRAIFGEDYRGLPPLTQTRDRAEREARARLFRARARLSDRVLVDEEGQSVQRLFGAPPGGNKIVVVDVRGRLAFQMQGSMVSVVETVLDPLLEGRKPPRESPQQRIPRQVLKAPPPRSHLDEVAKLGGDGQLRRPGRRLADAAQYSVS